MKIAMIVIGVALAYAGMQDKATGFDTNESHARMVKMTAEQCELQGKIAYTAGVARDQGKSERELSRGIDKVNHDTATIIHATYSAQLRGVTPESLAVGAYRSCMNRSVGER